MVSFPFPPPPKQKIWMIFFLNISKTCSREFLLQKQTRKFYTPHPILYQIFYPLSTQNLDDG